MPTNEDRVRRDLEILGLELSASEGMRSTSVVKICIGLKLQDVSYYVWGGYANRLLTQDFVLILSGMD